METVFIAINFLWLWVCLAPVLLIIAFLLIRKGLKSTTNLYAEYIPMRTHKHDHRYNFEKSKYTLSEKTSINTTYDNHAVFTCHGCGDEQIYDSKYTYGKSGGAGV